MMKLILIFLLVGNCGLVKGMIKEYIYFSGRTDWQHALWHCRNHYSDLVTFSNTDEQQQLVKIFGSSKPGWIGLYRDCINSPWMWADGKTISYSAWYSGFPAVGYYNYQYNCAYLEQGQWKNSVCWWGSFPFYCYTHLIFVKEKKTWQDAVQYCTTKYTGLASLPSATQVLQANIEMAECETESVWTGLRFMNGEWFWLSEESRESLDLLPSCPARPYHCGALNNKTNIWENRDCNEKLNFLCYLN